MEKTWEKRDVNEKIESAAADSTDTGKSRGN
jgi:hypothetical protein